MVPEGWLTLATVLKPRGNRGELIVDLLTDSRERLADVQFVSCFKDSAATKRELEVEEVWDHAGKTIVKFAGVDTIDQADTLRGFDLCIPLSERRQPRAGEVFLSDFVGCEVFDKRAKLLGKVTDWYEAGHQVWLELEPDQVLVPYVPAFFVELDLPNKRLVAEFPEGLLEVNRP